MTDESFKRIRLLEQRADRLESEVVERNRIAESLRESESRYRQLFDANPLPMWVYDLGTLRFLAVNDAAIDHYGYSREQFLAMTIADIRPERDVAALRASVGRAQSGIEHAGVWRHRKRDGAIIFVEITSHVIEFSGRRAKLVLATDITERIEQDQKIARLNRIRAVKNGISSAMVRLRNRDELLQEACRVAATEGVFPIVWIRIVDREFIHADRIIWHGNKDALDLIQRLAERKTWPTSDRPTHRAVQNRHPVIINDLFSDPLIAPARDELLQQGYRSCASFPLCVEGSVAAVLTFLAKEQGFFDTEEVALLEALSADLSYALEYIEKSQRLDYLASYDTLTRLPNARLFSDRLEQFVNAVREEQHSTVCVVAMDLERFTQINDTLGREAADELLRQVAARFEDTLKEPYTLGRIAADTFAAARPAQSESIARKLPDQLFEALQQPFIVGEREVHLTAQAGIALFPTDGDDGGMVFQNAEAALKSAKSSDERYAYYSTEMNARIAARRLLEEQLRTAVATQQFVMHYQPRIDMVSGELVGAEALIRWQHPDKGLTFPGDFIAVAEETGLIVEIGAWAIDAVCKQQAAWLAAGINAVPIAVNLSSVQFDTEGLLSVVRSALAAHQLDAHLIELELTETTVMMDAAAAAKTLQALRKMGIGLSLDDFGTGYSSLAVLKRFPFQSVKIDRSFVADITQNAEDAAIATAIIAMAHRLNLTVVAEGVETEGQFNYLRLQNCDEMQGNFFSAAVPKDAFELQLRGDKRIQLPAETGEGRTLLVVDDEPGIRSALARMLRSDGYRILTASGGAEALELLAVNRVQVIISDQRMPGMSGTEFLNIVKQLYPDTVRIILSGYTDLQVVTESVNRGAVFRFLTKPWDDDLLREQVRDAFRRVGEQTGSVALGRGPTQASA